MINSLNLTDVYKIIIDKRNINSYVYLTTFIGPMSLIIKRINISIINNYFINIYQIQNFNHNKNMNMN